ncbi:hypothetical protein M407DRAFT_6955 [Tulasnella calospora MUT 4182]|uniref:RRM domain-containing protein n=1 Tax=Tulasnella calospora MUT 4182 TaxID=1051891 RepID=A0A0C3QMI5_9AGAM|nr:hypothetical protein M407DRAFT_6955 [Tulasnella calospora MUT 4182]
MDLNLSEVVTSESNEGSKIVVSGLPLEVTALQVKELFLTIIGPVKECNINYDDTGLSTGSATVIFTRSEDAQRTYWELNDRSIDGVHTLRIQIVVESSGAPEASLAPSGDGEGEARDTGARALAGDDGQGPQREAGGANVANDEAAPKA